MLYNIRYVYFISTLGYYYILIYKEIYKVIIKVHICSISSFDI